MNLENTNTEDITSLNDILNSINLKESDNQIIKNTIIEDNTQESINKNVQLFTHEIDRRIGNYLLNELEKKQLYVNELEEVIKFQEKEIFDLKEKIKTNEELYLIEKNKSNLNSKSSEMDTKLNKESDKQKVINVIKSIQNNNEQSYSMNKDLVMNTNSLLKVKSISKEDEEPIYNGITILDKSNKNNTSNIILDYQTETDDSNDTVTTITKQRRRCRNL